ncbi:imelysin family protein [Tenacibaculum sp. nBUS_03]|uniref:imelysin family protein n=1 Tax=Tenacibaculum sp. nBUS_03 TaxID=3395320 RepID=UPI003EB7B98C
MKKAILLLTIVSFFYVSCSSDNTETPDYKKEIVTSVTNQIILPNLNTLIEKSTALKNSVEEFSNNQNATNLLDLRSKLTSITEFYAKMYIFNIGLAKNNFINRKINFWPVYNISIEKNINEGNFTQSSILNLGSAAKNLPGLNYLIFKEQNATDLLKEYNLNANRIKYLKFITNEFHDNIKQLSSIWTSTGSNYAESFKSNKEDGLLSSFNLLYNGLYNVIDNCKVAKIGKPSGLEKSSHTNPEIVESFYAENSLDLIYSNISSVEEIFFSDKITSISSYIKSITKSDDLNNRIKNKINIAKETIGLIKTPLKEAVNTDTDKVNVAKLHVTLKELLVLLHTDVRSVLSIIITGTDNDGD